MDISVIGNEGCKEYDNLFDDIDIRQIHVTGKEIDSSSVPQEELLGIVDESPATETMGGAMLAVAISKGSKGEKYNSTHLCQGLPISMQ